MAVSVTPSSKLNSVETLLVDNSTKLNFSADVYGNYWHTLEIQHLGKVIFITSPFELIVGSSEKYTYELSNDERTSVLTVMRNFKNIEVSIALRTYSSKSADNLVGLPSAVRSVFSTSSRDSAPTISNFSYLDVSGSAVSVTGNNQVIIQGVSELQIKVEGASAHNGAEILGYRVTCKGKTMFSASPVVDFGRVESCGDVVFYVTVIDTRGYSITVQKIISVIEYEPPEVSFTLYRDESNSVLVMADVSATISSAGGTNSFVSLEKRERNLLSESWSDWELFSYDTSFTGQLSYCPDRGGVETEVRASDMFLTGEPISERVFPTFPNIVIERDYINVYGSLMLNGFGVMGYRGTVTSGFSNYTTSGLYGFDGTNLTDCPEATKGILEVMGIDGFVLQRLYCESGNIHWRICSDEIWTEWFN